MCVWIFIAKSIYTTLCYYLLPSQLWQHEQHILIYLCSIIPGTPRKAKTWKWPFLSQSASGENILPHKATPQDTVNTGMCVNVYSRAGLDLFPSFYMYIKFVVHLKFTGLFEARSPSYGEKGNIHLIRPFVCQSKCLCWYWRGSTQRLCSVWSEKGKWMNCNCNCCFVYIKEKKKKRKRRGRGLLLQLYFWIKNAFILIQYF